MPPFSLSLDRRLVDIINALLATPPAGFFATTTAMKERPEHRLLREHVEIAEKLQADRVNSDTSTDAERIADALAETFRHDVAPDRAFLGVAGVPIATRAWGARTLGEIATSLDRENDAQLSRDVIRTLCAEQQSSGAFLAPAPANHPETVWYDELVILHAVTGYATSSRDERAAAAVQRAARYHLAETQPDHATTEPWGLLAFMLDPSTSSLAEQMLHTVRVHQPAGVSGVARLLLQDVRASFRLLPAAP